MPHFLRRNHALLFGTSSKKYLKRKSQDCYLYSNDGSRFMIHHEILGQTPFLRKILNTVKNCCLKIEIFCPCSDKELGLLIRFLYSGKIICEDVDYISKTIDNLKEIFGFPTGLTLWPEDISPKTPNVPDFSIKEDLHCQVQSAGKGYFYSD